MHSFFNNLLNFYWATDFGKCLGRLDSELMHVEFHNVHFVSSSRMRAILIMFQQSFKDWMENGELFRPICGKVMLC